MKTAIYCCVFTLVSLWTLNSFGQGSCHNDQGGGFPDYGGAGYPNGQPSPYGAGAAGPYYPTQSPAIAPTVAHAGPTARITLVSANSVAGTRTTSTAPSAKLTLVADVAPAVPKPVEVATVAPAVAPEPEAIDSAIAGLVGTWKAVARHGDGELTTVELHLDNRGWAELTVPGSDGKPATTKSRVNLDNQELKLTGIDKVVTLGKLVDFNSRQMVLERAGGQLTFVRL